MVAITTKNVTPKVLSKVWRRAVSTGLCVGSKTPSSWKSLSRTSSKKIRVLSLSSAPRSFYTFIERHFIWNSFKGPLWFFPSWVYLVFCITFTPAVLWLQYFDYRRSICVRLVRFRSFTCLSQTEDTDCEPIFKLDFDTGFFSLLFFFFFKMKHEYIFLEFWGKKGQNPE